VNEHDEKAEERVEDLDVPEEEAEDVQGGNLLGLMPAIQTKVDKQDVLGTHVPKFGGGASFGDGSV
jgi:hypothetical protein